MNKEIEEKEKITPPHVYHGLKSVIGEISLSGIKKDVTISFRERSYKGRSTEIIVKKIAELFDKHNLSIVSSFIKYEISPVTKFDNFKKQSVEEYRYFVEMAYTINSSVDGSNVTGHSIGDALVSNDKGLQSAITLAFKNFLAQTFLIAEGEGDIEPDVSPVHQVEYSKNDELDKIKVRAQKVLDNLIQAFMGTMTQEEKQILYQDEYYKTVNHLAFPDDIRKECVKFLDSHSVRNAIII